MHQLKLSVFEVPSYIGRLYADGEILQLMWQRDRTHKMALNAQARIGILTKSCGTQ